MKKKNAFTLAEVLITLGIIGIVAAMTITILIGAYQKHVTISKLKKIYSQIKQIETRIVAEYDDLSNVTDRFSPDGDLIVINKFFKPYLETIRICDKDCSYDYIDVYSENLSSTADKRGFYTKDGILILINDYHIGYNGAKIWGRYLIDINGPKKPNIPGRDMFLAEFQINCSDRGGSPTLLLFPSSVGYSCTSKRKDGCFAKIFKDGWEIKDDYPW